MRGGDILESVVGDGAGAEVVGVVQTHLDTWSAGTGESRQVTGGATFHTLSLIICQQVVFKQLTLGHPLHTDRKRETTKDDL